MRLRIASLCAVLLLAAWPAGSAPTCWDAAARTVRCGTAGALAVGTALTPAQLAAQRSRPWGLPMGQLIGLISVLGGLFTLLALLPDFDGWDGRQE